MLFRLAYYKLVFFITIDGQLFDIYYNVKPDFKAQFALSPIRGPKGLYSLARNVFSVDRKDQTIQITMNGPIANSDINLFITAIHQSIQSFGRGKFLQLFLYHVNQRKSLPISSHEVILN